MQLLVDLLQPIGDYRRRNIIPSKGKRQKTRTRKDADPCELGAGESSQHHAQMPSIFHHLTIGFNSTVRVLEAMSRCSDAGGLPDMQQSGDVVAKLGVVCICRSVLPDIITTSIPLLVATASSEGLPIRLVQLSANAKSLLAEALHQPRVGFLGVCIDAPDVEVFLSLVRAAVTPVQVPRLEGPARTRYLPVQIESTTTAIGPTSKSNASTKPPQQAVSRDTPEKGAAHRTKKLKTGP